MGLISAKCPRCNAVIQLEGQNRVGFCSSCGGRVVTQEAIKRFNQDNKVEKEQEQRQLEQSRVLDRNYLRDAQLLLEQKNYETAGSMFRDVARRDAENSEAAWGYIRCATKGLSPMVLKHPEDYAYEEATKLFESDEQGLLAAWKTQYWDAFAEACYATVDSLDARVYVQLEIFRWSPQTKTFMYPVSREFDLSVIFEKTLKKPWDELHEALPPEKREHFTEVCANAYKRVREYFLSGFNNLDALRQGDFSLLLGAWQLKLSTGAMRTDVLNFALNQANSPYCEALRFAISNYDYYRAIHFDQRNRMLFTEYRHFPSILGPGGDFFLGGDEETPVTLVALYDYILVIPTAMYTRTTLNKISGIDHALAYSQKCMAMPCFQRNSKKSAVQVYPMANNFDSTEPSKQVKSCYIATAVYGDKDMPEVCTLRRFRDNGLNRNPVGRRLVMFYYRHSPGWAERLKGKRRLNRMVKTVLDGVVRVLRWFERRSGGR